MTVFEKINSELKQGRELRLPLLEKLESYFECKVITYYTSFDNVDGAITEPDSTIINDVLSANKEKSPLLLIINSPGGDPHTAERIIKICREWSAGDFFALIPDKAKSAATMICLGARKIYMTPTSELGPIDVQVPWGKRFVPAHIIIKSYEELLEKCENLPKNKRVEPYLQQLQDYNAAQIESLRLARDLAKEIAEKFLKNGMLQDISLKEIRKLMHPFLDPEELKSHGRPIFYSDIKEIDRKNKISVECINFNDPIYPVVNEYNLRVLTAMATRRLAKLCESISTSFVAKA